jgi:excinuclease ABC subunit A
MIVSQTKAEGSKGGTDLPFSELLACPEHGTTLAEIEPRTFSFNTPHGACPECQGLGIKLEIDPDRIIPDRSLSIAEGAIAAGEWSNQGRDRRGYYWQLVEAVAEQYDIDLDVPVSSLSKKKVDLILYGTQGEQISVKYQSREGRNATFKTAYEGIIGNLERRYQETQSEDMRSRIQEFMSERRARAAAASGCAPRHWR